MRETLGSSVEKWEEIKKNQIDEEVRLTFRCPKHLIDMLDKVRKERPGSVSRNQTIIEAIDSYMKIRRAR